MPLNRSALDRRKENGGSIRRRRIEFNNALNLTVRASRPLQGRLRPTSRRTAAGKGRATRPAGYRERYAD